jgi:hypothetical protein
MNLTRNRLHSIGWAVVLSICLAFAVVLTLRVNAVKGQVRQTESRIVSLKREIQFLDVEFQTRANQRQLAALNAIEFGYMAPSAGQYIEGERQLAALGMPRGPGAPRPIRMASAAVTDGDATPFMEMVSPVGARSDGEKAAAAPSSDAKRDGAKKAASDDAIGAAIAEAKLGTKLARIDLAQGADE